MTRVENPVSSPNQPSKLNKQDWETVTREQLAQLLNMPPDKITDKAIEQVRQIAQEAKITDFLQILAERIVNEDI